MAAAADSAAPRLRGLPRLTDDDQPASARPADAPWWQVDASAAPAARPSDPAAADSDFRADGGPVDPAAPQRDPRRATGHAPGRPQATGHGATAAGATATVAPEPPGGPAPGAELELVPASVIGSVHHWTGMARLNAARPGGLAHGIVAGSPPSAREHLDYVGSRAWVPPGHPGGVISPAGAFYGYTLGLLGVTIGNAITWTFHKPMRLLLVGLIIGFLTLIGIVCT